MKNAFLVSDEDLKSLRNGEPWSIELQGQAVFLHENVLKLLMQRQVQQPLSNLVPNVNGPLDTKGRPLTCDQPNCVRNDPALPFPTYSARNTHRALIHHIPGEFSEKHHRYPRRLPETPKLPPPETQSEHTAKHYGAKSYDFKEFDAKAVCGICEWKPKSKRDVRSIHFHRSVVHGVRGINWNRKSHIEARNKAKRTGPGRPKGVKVEN